MLYVLEGCELHASLPDAQQCSSMSTAVVKETLQRRFLETPLDELSNMGSVDGTCTPPVSKRCTRFYEVFRTAARVRRLSDEVGVAPSRDCVSRDANQSEKRCARASFTNEHSERKAQEKMDTLAETVGRPGLQSHDAVGRERRACHGQGRSGFRPQNAFLAVFAGQKRGPKSGPRTCAVAVWCNIKPSRKTGSIFEPDGRSFVLTRPRHGGRCGTARETRLRRAARRSFA